MSDKNPKNIIFFVLFISIFLAGFFILKEVLEVHAYPDEDKYTIIRSDPNEIEIEASEERAGEGEQISVETALPDSAENPAYERQEADAESQLNESAVGNDSKKYFEKLVIDYKNEILKDMPPSKNRTDIVVRYYHHQADQDKVLELQKYGFYLHERPVADKLNDYPSNALFYGDSVPLRDIKLIAYVLLENGIDLKKIAESRYHDSWKSNAVEIGTDTTLIGEPNMTIGEIQSFEK